MARIDRIYTARRSTCTRKLLGSGAETQLSGSVIEMALQIAVVRDFREEGWPSMDLCADMLLANPPPLSSGVVFQEIAPKFRRNLSRVPILGKSKFALNVERLWNRRKILLNEAAIIRYKYDFFHVVDHSYAHLVHGLPTARTGVYCHDIDAFRCLLDPLRERRPWWFRKMTRRILSGLQSAAIVFHNTRATGDALLRYGLVDAGKLRHAPLGVAPEFLVEVDREHRPPELEILAGAPFVLHVGSCIPRKRIDVLLSIYSRLRQAMPSLRLVKVGEHWTARQLHQIAELRIAPDIIHLGRPARSRLAQVYRHASVVLVPSDAEGFGLPVIEGLASGTAVVASDLATLREAGGDAAAYAPVADIEAWTIRVMELLQSETTPQEREKRRRWAARFSWNNHAGTIAEAYRELAPPLRACTGG